MSKTFLTWLLGESMLLKTWSGHRFLVTPRQRLISKRTIPWSQLERQEIWNTLPLSTTSNTVCAAYQAACAQWWHNLFWRIYPGDQLPPPRHAGTEVGEAGWKWREFVFRGTRSKLDPPEGASGLLPPGNPLHRWVTGRTILPPGYPFLSI